MKGSVFTMFMMVVMVRLRKVEKSLSIRGKTGARANPDRTCFTCLIGWMVVACLFVAKVGAEYIDGLRSTLCWSSANFKNICVYIPSNTANCKYVDEHGHFSGVRCRVSFKI